MPAYSHEVASNTPELNTTWFLVPWYNFDRCLYIQTNNNVCFLDLIGLTDKAWVIVSNTDVNPPRGTDRNILFPCPCYGIHSWARLDPYHSACLPCIFTIKVTCKNDLIMASYKKYQNINTLLLIIVNEIKLKNETLYFLLLGKYQEYRWKENTIIWTNC